MMPFSTRNDAAVSGEAKAVRSLASKKKPISAAEIVAMTIITNKRRSAAVRSGSRPTIERAKSSQSRRENR
jgi:hypothetical protein